MLSKAQRIRTRLVSSIIGGRNWKEGILVGQRE